MYFILYIFLLFTTISLALPDMARCIQCCDDESLSSVFHHLAPSYRNTAKVKKLSLEFEVFSDPLCFWHNFFRILKVHPPRKYVNFRTLTTYTPRPPKRQKLATTPTILSTESTRAAAISTAPQVDTYGGLFLEPVSGAPPAKAAPFFRNDYTYVQSTATFYKFHKLKSTWSNALTTCINEGAGLAVPTTEAEAKVLLNEFSLLSDVIWLAISDLSAEGLFFTFDGLPLSDIYSNWSPGEPNDAGDQGEDCVAMNKEGFYNDVKCGNKNTFVCSTGDRNFTQNTACQTYDKSYTKEGMERCYKLHIKPKTWHEAFKICRDEQAYLTVVNSDAEAELLANKFAKAPAVTGKFDRGLLLVDFSDLHVHGVYRTNAGGKPLEESGYLEWSPGQPDNYGGDEHCGSIFKNGLLNDVNCNHKAMFVCEKDITP